MTRPNNFRYVRSRQNEALQTELYKTPTSTYLNTMFEEVFSKNVGPLFLEKTAVSDLNRNASHAYGSPKIDPKGGRLISGEEANELYGTDIDPLRSIRENAAKKMGEIKQQERQRMELLSHAQPNFVEGALGFGMGALATLLDPINIGAGVLPEILQLGKVASMVARTSSSPLARTFGRSAYAMSVGARGSFAGRVGLGAAEGIASQALLEAPTLSLTDGLGLEYTAYDSYMNLAVGGVLGGSLHGLSHILGRVFDHGKVTQAEQGSILRAAVGQSLENKNIRVDPMVGLLLQDRYGADLPQFGSRFLKSAEASAEVFAKALDDNDQVLAEAMSLLGEDEVFVKGLTGIDDLVEAQKALASDISYLENRAATLQKQFKDIDLSKPGDRDKATFLSTQMSDIYNRLEPLRNTYDRYLDTRNFTSSLIEEAEQLPTLSRSELRRGDLIDQNFEALVDELPADLRKKINVPEGINRAITKTLLEDISEAQRYIPQSADEIQAYIKQQTLPENSRLYNPELVTELNSSIEGLPSNFDIKDAETLSKSVEELSSELKKQDLLDENDIIELEKADQLVKESEDYSKALEQAALCVKRNS